MQSFITWPGQDGFDYYFQNIITPNGIIPFFLKEISAYAPDIRIGYEYKPKEPRMFFN